MRESNGILKLKIDSWMIIGRMVAPHVHELWHECDKGYQGDDGSTDARVWEVRYRPARSNSATLGWLTPGWRCNHCSKQAPDDIVAAFTLLEMDYCVAQVQRVINNT